ncbi:hypothetical protein F383_34675 [Gossypium arboreum]|uniref:Uncharacterized protein n=1 Tax=Gossypium arboreum TaxID=29729 RepID=A0A0B0MYL6_GOSAR|nr:hypothetical protein F383_34675 [Gossypium arboreum]
MRSSTFSLLPYYLKKIRLQSSTYFLATSERQGCEFTDVATPSSRDMICRIGFMYLCLCQIIRML